MEIKEIFETMSYGPAPETEQYAQEWMEKYNRKFDLFINGEFRAPKSGQYIDSINPSNKKKMAEIANANEEDVNDAVAAAKAAFPKWRDLGGHGRARYIYAIARQIQKHSRLFAVLESMDNGKPIRESRDVDVPLTARHFYHHAGWAQQMGDDPKLQEYEPLGVVGAIVPWNFPLLIFSWKVAPALAAGNTVVIKPAQLTSLTALFFAEICKNVGLPSGVFNLATGSGSKTGTYITNHPDISKITFTGSTQVGQILRRAIAGSGKKITLELGGKSPYIVFADADIDSAIEGLVEAIWFNQGQVCCAGSRLLVHESIEKDFIERLKLRMSKLRVGNPLDKAIDIGAIVDKKQLDTIASYVKIGEEEGGEKYEPDISCPFDEGYYHRPVLFTNVSTTDTIVQEEIFGPVLVSMTFRTPAEAVKLANNTRYGLAATIWSENINLALDIAPKLKAGTVWINCSNLFDASSGFGGYRESGFGREGGIEGLHDFVKPKFNKEFKDKPYERAIVINKSDESALPAIDRTAKMYIGGKQARPDGGYSIVIKNPVDQIVGEVGMGNRKDIRNAVEVASKSGKWSGMSAHNRAQVIYYIAENLIARKEEFVQRLMTMVGVSREDAEAEVEESIYRIYHYAGMVDKYDGLVHQAPFRNVILAMPEAVGVLGISCPDEYPLLGFISLVIPAITQGNNVVVLPSEKYPLSATDFYQVLDTSDVPGGTINIVTGNHKELIDVISKHDDVEGVWYFGNDPDKSIAKSIELNSCDNMKRTWLNFGRHRDWMNRKHSMGELFLRKASEIKNIWVPYGE